MRKTVVILLLLLAAVYIVLSLLDTSDYALEKRLWRLDRQFTRLAADPEAVPSQGFEKLARSYLSLAQAFPRSELTPRVLLKRTQVYLLNKEYEVARNNMERLLREYEQDEAIASLVLLSIAKVYQLENNWQAAADTFEKIIQGYPLTPIGLNVPLTVYSLYAKYGSPEDAQSKLDEALEFYSRVSREHPDSLLEFQALQLLASTHLTADEYQQAFEVLTDILLLYPTKPYMNFKRAEILIKSMNRLAMLQLKDLEAPIKVYEQFIVNNPDHSLNNYLQAVIVSLQRLRETEKTESEGESTRE